ncbi:MAG: hypothetical protein K8S98_02155 [Planctomycetes bacterium]|nr:hypothetical protein [Planctomycetota bacterium]
MLWTDFVPGRWLRRRPVTSGVYAMRPVGGVAYVNYFDANPAVPTPGQLECAIEHGGSSPEIEFLYLDGDELGRPTRADEPRVYVIARANGWTSYSDTPERRQ